VEILTHMSVGRFFVSKYRVVFDDCLEDLRINSKVVEEWKYPLCTLTGKIADLSPYLHPGENTVTAVIRDNGGYLVFNIQPAITDYFFFSASLLVIALLIVPVVTLLYRRFPRRALFFFAAVFILSSCLYWFLVTVTPYYVHAWDWKGHIEYIDYVASHFRIPPAQKGWEFYQPPLYYFFAAFWLKLSVFFHASREEALAGIQDWSFVCTMAAVAVAMWISVQVFPKKTQLAHALAFSAIVATFPGIALFTSRISNDIPFLLVSFLFIALLLRWWQRNKQRDWYALVVVIGVGLLIKSNTISLLVIALLCLALKKDIPFREKRKQAWYSLAIICLFSFWLFAFRFGVEGEKFIVGNHLSSKLQVTNSFSHFLVFNPVRTLRFPFNDNYSDIAGRQYFWENLFKSAFFGEWKYKPSLLAQAIYSVYFFALLAALVGMIRSIWKDPDRTLPLFVSLIIGLGTLIGYRLVSPFSPNQDFRFIPFIILSLVYYLVTGLYSICHPKKLQFIFLNAVIVLFNVLFVAGLIIRPL